MIRMALAAFMAAFLVVGVASADDLRIEFDPPTSREDGTALDPATEIAHYTVYCRAGDTYPDTGYEIPGQTETGEHATTYESLLAERGRYTCAMTATDTDGRESQRSNEVELSWLDQPGEPTSVIIVTD